MSQGHRAEEVEPGLGMGARAPYLELCPQLHWGIAVWVWEGHTWWGRLLVLARPNCPWLGAAVTLDMGWAAEKWPLSTVQDACPGWLMGSHGTWELGLPVRTLGVLGHTLQASLFSRIPGYLMPNLLEAASINPSQCTDPLIALPTCADFAIFMLPTIIC